jgi:hypothetical protein
MIVWPNPYQAGAVNRQKAFDRKVVVSVCRTPERKLPPSPRLPALASFALIRRLPDAPVDEAETRIDSRPLITHHSPLPPAPSSLLPFLPPVLRLSLC